MSNFPLNDYKTWLAGRNYAPTTATIYASYIRQILIAGGFDGGFSDFNLDGVQRFLATKPRRSASNIRAAWRKYQAYLEEAHELAAPELVDETLERADLLPYYVGYALLREFDYKREFDLTWLDLMDRQWRHVHRVGGPGTEGLVLNTSRADHCSLSADDYPWLLLAGWAAGKGQWPRRTQPLIPATPGSDRAAPRALVRAAMDAAKKLPTARDLVEPSAMSELWVPRDDEMAHWSRCDEGPWFRPEPLVASLSEAEAVENPGVRPGVAPPPPSA